MWLRKSFAWSQISREHFASNYPLYRTPETKGKRPFQVTDANLTDSVNLMVEYGGLDAKAKDNPKAFYSNDYLPKGGS